MDDRTYFDIEDGEELSPAQLLFLRALRESLDERLRPYCAELANDRLLLVLDIDAPNLALVNVGLELREAQLRGDRISVHDRTFPSTPTSDGFLANGTPGELAAQGAALLRKFASRPVVRHEWLHRGQVYADCYLFEDTGERLAEGYRSDLAPVGQEAQLIEAGHVHGDGWIQTDGLGEPHRVIRVPR